MLSIKQSSQALLFQTQHKKSPAASRGKYLFLFRLTYTLRNHFPVTGPQGILHPSSPLQAPTNPGTPYPAQVAMPSYSKHLQTLRHCFRSTPAEVLCSGIPTLPRNHIPGTLASPLIQLSRGLFWSLPLTLPCNQPGTQNTLPQTSYISL